ncbi:nitrous oxide-stimulated promoter family protein [Photobacterium profundum]|uniref:nitrous oxide-stimulated promoter family protein n=1 Tax=Photobacterium profundum TaxID=74109 RepID=UPI003D0BDCB4
MHSDFKNILVGSLRSEFKTVQLMTNIYCTAHHQHHKIAQHAVSSPNALKPNGKLCEQCVDFLEYALLRLDRCPYGENKPTCRQCPIHCYKPEYKAMSQKIMRYAGPRMLFTHPIFAIKHLLAERRPVPMKPTAGASNRHKRKHASRNK